eukprot:1861144-Pyramimonas_sp.AAC.1
MPPPLTPLVRSTGICPLPSRHWSGLNGRFSSLALFLRPQHFGRGSNSPVEEWFNKGFMSVSSPTGASRMIVGAFLCFVNSILEKRSSYSSSEGTDSHDRVNVSRLSAA